MSDDESKMEENSTPAYRGDRTLCSSTRRTHCRVGACEPGANQPDCHYIQVMGSRRPRLRAKRELQEASSRPANRRRPDGRFWILTVSSEDRLQGVKVRDVIDAERHGFAVQKRLSTRRSNEAAQICRSATSFFRRVLEGPRAHCAHFEFSGA
jgi:hypothetical protein